ncbi:MAG: hypothetical protein HY867_04780 [Chloroflexi bacterium]|nr:hypothetical protein [Chloroflexota bacterium]
MSSEEQRRILKMVEDGKISADEAMTLIRALEQNPDEAEVEVFEAAPSAGPAVEAPEFEEVKQRARKFAMIPLWIGVGITVLFAGLMFSAIQNQGFGFWFYCLSFPFLFGVLLMALSAGGRYARWMFVDVRQKPGETPGRITFGFPVPLGIVAWVLRNFGHHIKGLDSPDAAREIASMMNKTISSDSPLIVNVDDDDGTKVRVYIG